MTRSVLDTSVLIASDVPPFPGELAVSAASLAELHFGALVTDDPAVRAERVRRLAVIEHLFTPLPVDGAVARSYGHLASEVVRAGRQARARVMDLLIAATAHAHDAALLTRNAADLRGVEHLVEIVSV
ncbi:MAG TPA: PIN domain-containing protein [Acidimicrobiia bacterium]